MIFSIIPIVAKYILWHRPITYWLPIDYTWQMTLNSCLLSLKASCRSRQHITSITTDPEHKNVFFLPLSKAKLETSYYQLTHTHRHTRRHTTQTSCQYKLYLRLLIRGIHSIRTESLPCMWKHEDKMSEVLSSTYPYLELRLASFVFVHHEFKKY